MTEQEILFLNQDIVIGLIDLIDRKDVFTAVERAFGQHGRKKVQMPPKTYLNFSEHNGDARIMPSSTDFSDIFGTKIVTVFPENSKIGLPTVIGTILLNSKETGVLLAIMDGTTITNLRTGLAGAVAAKWLARENSSVAGMVGLGKQAETQLLALMPAGDIQTVRVYDLNEDAKFAFKKWAEEEFKLPLEKRHPIIKWYYFLCEHQRKTIKEQGQVYDAPMTGAVNAYLDLAYNLYCV